jgi:hypothetical protein
MYSEPCRDGYGAWLIFYWSPTWGAPNDGSVWIIPGTIDPLQE